MTTYNTGNPVGSADPRDLYDNAQNLDTAVVSQAPTWTDRLGRVRPTWAAMIAYQSLGDYAAGITITGYNQLVREDGEYYRLSPSVTVPYLTTGSWSNDVDDFVPVGDAALRSELAASSGSELVGYSGNTVAKALDAYRVASMSALVTGTWTGINELQTLGFYADTYNGGAKFHHDGTTGGTQTTNTAAAIIAALASGQIISADGKGWVLSSASAFGLSQFGGVASTDNSAALTSLLTVAAARRVKALIDVTSTLTNITLPTYTNLEIRANLTHSSTATDCFTITDAEHIRIDFGWQQGFTTTRSGNKKLINITGTSDYANEHIEISNGRPTGGTGTMVEWYACRKLWFLDFSPCDADGTGIFSQSTPVTNPYRSNTVVFHGVNCEDLAGSNVCHGVSINAWNYVDNVFVNGCSMRGIKNNPIEIWANKAKIWENDIIDGAIPISCGACHWLLVHDNNIDMTTPSVSSSDPGAYGIEIGGCHFFNVHHNIIRGCRNGIRMTGSNINGGTNWYATTEQFSEAGTLDPTNTNRVRVLSRDYAVGNNYSGSILGQIDSNTILDCLDSGIYVRSDYYHTRSTMVANNRITRTGRFGAPTATLGAIALTNCRAEVHGNTIEDALYYGIYNSNSRVILGPNTFKKIDTTGPFLTVGAGASFNFLARQDFSECTISGECAGATPSQGTYFRGDQLFNHAISAGATSLGLYCITGGTQSNQLDTLTMATTAASATATISAIGDIQIGQRFTIAGVTGTKTVVDINYSTRAVTLDSVCDATVAAGAITHVAAVFNALPSIAA